MIHLLKWHLCHSYLSSCCKTLHRQRAWSNPFKNNCAFSVENFQVKLKRCHHLVVFLLWWVLSALLPVSTRELTGGIFIAHAWLKYGRYVCWLLFSLVTRIRTTYDKLVHVKSRDFRYHSTQAMVLFTGAQSVSRGDVLNSRGDTLLLPQKRACWFS